MERVRDLHIYSSVLGQVLQEGRGGGGEGRGGEGRGGEGRGGAIMKKKNAGQELRRFKFLAYNIPVSVTAIAQSCCSQ